VNAAASVRAEIKEKGALTEKVSASFGSSLESLAVAAGDEAGYPEERAFGF
jgi:hypothetical protein